VSRRASVPVPAAAAVLAARFRLAIALSALALPACQSSGPISVGSVIDPANAGGSAGSAACSALVPPALAASCAACSDEPTECANNGCADGFWCEGPTRLCVPPSRLAGCPRQLPISCDEVGRRTGCCGTDGHLYVCDVEDSYPLTELCPTGTCGWDAASGAYRCGTAGDADPSGQAPQACALSL
jgi:hypothetical protein